MTEAMDIARFEKLVAAYGAGPHRWPPHERAAAEALARSDPRATALLAEADSIDARLFAHQVPEPSRTLRARVMESALPRRRRPAAGVRLWWSGVALTLAAAGGALAGSAATAALDPTIAGIPLYEHDYLPAYDATSEENAR